MFLGICLRDPSNLVGILMQLQLPCLKSQEHGFVILFWHTEVSTSDIQVLSPT
jgi:hypothetical protein